ncbi:MupG family TIM beta-alpha barrel fold protein [Paenibacillus senegalensis]|uniref:MupG family TIM beta-alpha barrel fold protein n=1 Tax=Paenibacillus senegalensis TaxID=1465766 RepID=UPI000289CECA|nr:MupG family TIM beta-alpha barrel fold protein [Paenibacillus senegalensis]
MTELGQSIYPTLGIPEAERQLEEAIRAGCRHLFTSLHLPEAHADDWREVCQLFTRANHAGMSVAADVSRESLKRFGASLDDLSPLAQTGIGQLRLDHGFTLEETVRIIRGGEHRFAFQINAGTTTRDEVEQLIAQGVDPEKLIAVHNFYPRPETGVSLAFYRRQNRMFRQFGLKTAGFIPAFREPRAPLFAGLPTVETHRRAPVALAAAELAAEGLTDLVYFGDPAPGEEAWTSARLAGGGIIPLQVQWLEPIPEKLRPLLADIHTCPRDEAEFVHRSAHSRSYVQERGLVQPPRNTFERPAGTVTIDNERYPRYAGELQVTRIDLAADERVNVLGRVVAEDLPLLQMIGPGTRFMFVSTFKGMSNKSPK